MRRARQPLLRLVRHPHLVNHGRLRGTSQFMVRDCGEAGYQTFLEELLPVVARLLCDGEEEVRQAAAEGVVAAAHLLRPPDLGRHLLTLVLQLAHDDEREELRINAVRCRGIDDEE